MLKVFIGENKNTILVYKVFLFSKFLSFIFLAYVVFEARDSLLIESYVCNTFIKASNFFFFQNPSLKFFNWDKNVELFIPGCPNSVCENIHIELTSP